MLLSNVTIILQLWLTWYMIRSLQKKLVTLLALVINHPQKEKNCKEELTKIHSNTMQHVNSIIDNLKHELPFFYN